MNRKISLVVVGLVVVSVMILSGCANESSITKTEGKIATEADYILSGQYAKHQQHLAYGAINNVYGDPTWVVPCENAMAILGLIVASEVLNNESYLEQAQLSADYLIKTQNTSDGAWYDKYSYRYNLDENAVNWGNYTDGEGLPTWVIENVATPSIDGNSLRCSITGGDPYSNVHCYREFPSDQNATVFNLSLSFLFSPTTTFNNQNSIVQALEFSMSKWHQSKRYEFALQWENVEQNVGDGAPQWRYWNPHHPDKWVNLGISDTLEGEQWHSFTMEGEIINEQVHYRRFTIDQQSHNLDITVPPNSTSGEDDRLSVAIQLDGNSREDPYDVFIDQVSLEYTDRAKSPRQTAEVMMALYKLGYDHDRYNAMRNGAQYLMACQKVENKRGNDDGLVCGGKDANGQYHDWRWTHDNAYAYWALKAAETWAIIKGDISFASECANSSQRIIEGINTHLYDPATGVWHMAIDETGKSQWEPHLNNLSSWIQYAPQMLDLPVNGVNSAAVGEWIYNTFQQEEGSCIGYYWDKESDELKIRKYPGFGFQAALSWFDTGHAYYAETAILWAENSGLWNTTPGGWIDWVEIEPDEGREAECWQKFIDTSFYAIACWNGGYDFGVSSQYFDTGTPSNPYPSLMGTHTGTITPSHNITVSKLYTYPCAGTGGHTESIKLYENSTLIANGTWTGYLDEDWHNITLHNVTDATSYVTLLRGHDYNYTIRTGSYPQILHTTSKEVTGGTITCSSFVDTNGNIYTDWIPAISLCKE
ncbi:hypothetical protein C5S39_04145 [Candidatus Methanophagaceae archaeon]|nr:hypothetical protein C5S39_04145 [Methanophagales archaeon]